jgi:hypothetical protein
MLLPVYLWPYLYDVPTKQSLLTELAPAVGMSYILDWREHIYILYEA